MFPPHPPMFLQASEKAKALRSGNSLVSSYARSLALEEGHLPIRLASGWQLRGKLPSVVNVLAWVQLRDIAAKYKFKGDTGFILMHFYMGLMGCFMESASILITPIPGTTGNFDPIPGTTEHLFPNPSRNLLDPIPGTTENLYPNPSRNLLG